MDKPILSKAAVTRARTRLEPELGRLNLGRFDAVVALLDKEGRANLAAVLDRLYPGQKRDTALNNFRQFRHLFREAAASAGVLLALETDGQTRAAPEARTCWFEGDDGAVAAVMRFVEDEVAGTERSGQEVVELADPDAPLVRRYFVSYAHKDGKDVKKLLAMLGDLLKGPSDYRFERWIDTQILPGEPWNEEIRAKMENCHFGLLFVSPAFLGSTFIWETELPHFVPPNEHPAATRRCAIPVALHRVPLDGSLNLKELAQRQIFFNAKGQAFEQCRSAVDQREFAQQLFDRIVRVLDKQQQAPVAPKTGGPRSRVTARELPWEQHFRDAVAAGEDGLCFVPTRGYFGSLDKLDDGTPANELRTDAIEYLEKWALDPDGPSYCALLGDVGMGKTTTCRAFAARLLAERPARPELPLPIYLDLRLLGDSAKDEPQLPTILAQVLSRSWRGGGTDYALHAEELIRLVQRAGALVIFDGLDEVLVHLTAAQGQRFARELFRILPPLRKNQSPAAGDRRGRLLLTCRTHYFRTLRDQKTFLTAEGRDGIGHEDYRALVLLPFTEPQIRSYLRQALADDDPDRAMEVIRSVHNLSEIAERPYTLSLIARHFHQIERWRAEGRKVTGLMLYRHMVLSWLERDTGKHQLSPDHKQALMEHFAASLWRSGKRLWRVGEVEQWLIDFLEANPRIAAHYVQANREVLKEDLRTATFLVREGEDGFRFAHTSLQEFFLAGHLRRALVAGEVAALNLRAVSHETLHFLGQWLADDDEAPAALATLGRIRDGYVAGSSEIAFDYTLYAQEHGLPAPSPAGFQLPGAKLADRVFAGKDGSLLNLARINLNGANLRRTRWRQVNLDGAGFGEARLTQAEFIGCRLNAAQWQRADLTAALFRECTLSAGVFDDALCRHTQFLLSALDGTRGLPTTRAEGAYAGCRDAPLSSEKLPGDDRVPWAFPCSPSSNSLCWSPDGARLFSAGHDGTLRVWDAASGEALLTLLGHEGRVTSCAWSPDDTRLLSAGDDGTLRVRDAAGGEALLTLRGHKGGVTSCAWSPDAARLLSAGEDGTLRVWDAAGGEALLTLLGHEGGVTSCAWSPDAARLLSAGEDGTLRVWDPVGGEALLTLRGNEGGVTNCAWSPEGGRLLSAGRDGTLRVWDAAGGEALLTLRGHEGGVRGCAWSPDGARLLSAGDDGTLRVWDAAGGEALLTLRGHRCGVRSCAWSPDGARLISAGDDGTPRVWDAAGGEALLTLRSHEHRVTSCAWSPDAARLLSAGDDGTLRVWDVAGGEALQTLRGHAGRVTSCAWSPDAARLLAAGGDGTLRVWDAAGGEALLTLRGHEHRVTSCAWSPDGARLLSAGGDGTLRAWDSAGGEVLLTLRGHKSGVTSCAWSPDAARLLSAGDDGTLRVWDAAGGEALLTLRGHEGGVTSCAWSPDGARLLSAGGDGTLRVWDAAGGQALLTLRGHEGGVTSCAWSPDAARLISAGGDGTLRVWDAAGGEALLTLRGHEGRVASCAWSPDNSRLLSAGDDGTLRVWDAVSGEEQAIRRYHLGADEWCVLDLDANAVLCCGAGAWRWLRWEIRDPLSGARELLPAEYFGPLPARAGAIA